MSVIVLPALFVGVVAAIAFAVTSAMTVRARAVEPGTADPFAPVNADPSADTLSVSQTTPPAVGEWRVATLTNLRQVEDLLDALEAQGVQEREVFAIGENTFAVRWR